MKNLLHLGLIRPSTSPRASPVVLVPKKDGTKRLCVDYCQLKKVTMPDPFPMPWVDRLIDRIGTSLYIPIFYLNTNLSSCPLASWEPRPSFNCS